MLIVTTNDVPGYRVVKTLGLVRGITVRSRNAISDVVGGLQSMLGGRVGTYVKLAETSRAEALQEMVDHAQAMGANAVIGIDFDYEVLGETNGMMMVAVSGTAVKLG